MSSAGVAVLVTTVMLTALPTIAAAQVPSNSNTRPAPTHLGVQGIASVSVGFPAASKTFEALGLDTKPLEIGGAAQVTGLWRDLFAQVSATRSSSTGERVFVDDSGETFPLGIPLSVKATYVDVSVGWRFAPRDDSYRNVWAFGGGGAGVVKFRETSPFAESGDDVDESPMSYHVMGGLEIRLLKWLGVSADVRYRWVRDLLGDGGVSKVLGDDDFGGFQAGVGLRIGIGQDRPRPSLPDVPEARDTTTPVPSNVQRREEADSATILGPAPVYLRPDETREPLRTLDTGTLVKVLLEDGDWIKIEFQDRLLGPRIGYVLRKHIHIPRER